MTAALQVNHDSCIEEGQGRSAIIYLEIFKIEITSRDYRGINDNSDCNYCKNLIVEIHMV
jgi:hypothetical protein